MPTLPSARALFQKAWPIVAAYVLFAAGLFALTDQFERHEALSGIRWHKILELPFVLYLYWFFRQLVKGHRWAPVLAAIPVYVGYVLLDGYYLMFGRVFRISEINELPELLDVLPWYVSAVLVAAIAAVVIASLLSLRRVPPLRLVLSALPLALLIGVAELRPEWFLQGFKAVANGIIEWSDEEHVRWNGRFTTVLYHEAKRNAAIRAIAEHRSEPRYEERHAAAMEALRAVAKRRNVHVIVWEGFVDPKRLEKLKLSRDAVHPELRALLREGKGDLSVSPVFGGYTAQAEFEVLCGVPALQQLGTIEFNVFSGQRIHCLPSALREVGYRTVATNAYKPNFFNAITAYRGTGFEQQYYAREYVPRRESYFSIGDVTGEKYMFDGTLFEQNLAFVRERLAEDPDTPLFNYVLTIYGHFPFWIDEKRRPPMVSALNKNPIDRELMIIVNQVWYRSEALAKYLRGLRELDPDGIVVIVSDHLPPLQDGRAAYERLGYIPRQPNGLHHTLLAVFDRGKPVKAGTVAQHDIPALIYGLLTDGAYCAGNRCERRSDDDLRADYLQLMSHAVANDG